MPVFPQRPRQSAQVAFELNSEFSDRGGRSVFFGSRAPLLFPSVNTWRGARRGAGRGGVGRGWGAGQPLPQEVAQGRPPICEVGNFRLEGPAADGSQALRRHLSLGFSGAWPG